MLGTGFIVSLRTSVIRYNCPWKRIMNRYHFIFYTFLYLCANTVAYAAPGVVARSSSEIIPMSDTGNIGCLVTTASSELVYAEIIRFRQVGSSYEVKRIFGNADRFLKRLRKKGERTLLRKLKRDCLSRAYGDVPSSIGGGSSGGGGGEEGSGGGNSNCPVESPFSSGANTGIDACEVLGASSHSQSLGLASEVSERIINGNQCETGDSPIVRLLITSSDGVFACTGTVVAPRVVIFAAHCLASSNVRTVTIVPGGSTQNSVTATSFAKSQAYDFGDDGVYGNDDVAIALTECDLPTRAVPILQKNDLSVGETGLIAGYGNRDSSLSPGTDSGSGAEDGSLFGGKLVIAEISQEEIISEYSYAANPVPGENSNTCVGDSGGPLVVERDGEWVLAGITSYGNVGCGPEDISGFANITDSAIRSFIAQYAPEVIQ
ncbi:MAG: trypsin-like serine protease [Bdellovibrionales bacterium]|nr:trypsin-like serine protease [Bdellovibrionales bacterium]